jgi:hypothetical protein|tara:strand:+ start:113 stop:331 length:219 start_codon:yes stop_codon:yes gene_type:complete
MNLTALYNKFNLRSSYMKEKKEALIVLGEKELVKRADELTALVNEVEAELIQVIESLETKGWVLSDKGWVIE